MRLHKKKNEDNVNDACLKMIVQTEETLRSESFVQTELTSL